MNCLPKIETCCSKDELRPSMMHVFITKENIVATNAIVVIYHKTEDYFNDEFINQIPENGIYILGTDFAKFSGKVCSFEWKTEGVIKVWAGKSSMLIETKEPGKFPNWEGIIPTDSDQTEVKQICFNPDQLALLSKGLKIPKSDANYMKFVFHGENRPIKCTFNNNNGVGLLFTCRLNN